MLCYYDSSILLAAMPEQGPLDRSVSLWEPTQIRLSPVLSKIESMIGVRRAGMLQKLPPDGPWCTERIRLLDSYLDELECKRIDDDIHDMIRKTPSLANCRSLDAIHVATALALPTAPLWAQSGEIFYLRDDELRDSGSAEPVIEPVVLQTVYPNRFNNAVLAIENELWNGGDPIEARSALTVLADYPGLTCEGSYTCDHYYYLLGLSNELYGDEQPAVDAYLQVWRDYARSPYTTLARLKLEGLALPVGPTGTVTATPSPTTSGTPATLTPTRTPTPTLDGATQPTDTPSPTLDPDAPYIYYTPTPYDPYG